MYGWFFWLRWVKYVSDPSTSEPNGSFAQDDQVGGMTLLQDDRSWKVYSSLRLWNLEGSATVVVANVRSSEVIPVRLTGARSGWRPPTYIVSQKFSRKTVTLSGNDEALDESLESNGYNPGGVKFGLFFWQRRVKYVSDPSTSEPCSSFAQDDQVGEGTFL